MKNLIAYSLYGQGARYTVGAIKNAIIVSQNFPEYDLRFYVGESVPDWCTSALKLFKNVQVVEMFGPEDARSMFWRFYALADLEYDYVLVRDCDARLNQREIDMHQEFVESDKSFHIIKDHPTGHNYIISGGMFAAKKTAVHDIHKLVDAWEPKNHYCNDMVFLRELVYPRIADDCLIHDEYYATPGSIKSRIAKTHTLDMVGAAVDHEDRFVYEDDRETSMRETGSEYYRV